MASADPINTLLAKMAAAASNPRAYADGWKARSGGKIVGVLPMNFPLELVHAAGALPLLLQESRAPLTVGRSMLFEFYCGYTRSLVDQAMTGQLAELDAIFLVDHCVALLGAADAIRFQLPNIPVYLAQFMASMDEATTRRDVAEKVGELRARLEQLCGSKIDADALAKSIALYNRNRGLQRQLYDHRRAGGAALTAAQMQIVVKSSMVMEVAEHSALLEPLVAAVADRRGPRADSVKLHLSGHFCHAPRPELFDMIESCGAQVVDDDLYTGNRFITTDVSPGGEPMAALVSWYFDRNVAWPCPTRAQKGVDWESALIRSIEASGAQGVVVMMAKFCEPHMLYFPELRKALTARGIPFLLIETEHEGQAVEMLRTRVEALVEQVRGRAPLAAA